MLAAADFGSMIEERIAAAGLEGNLVGIQGKVYNFAVRIASAECARVGLNIVEQRQDRNAPSFDQQTGDSVGIGTCAMDWSLLVE